MRVYKVDMCSLWLLGAFSCNTRIQWPRDTKLMASCSNSVCSLAELHVTSLVLKCSLPDARLAGRSQRTTAAEACEPSWHYLNVKSACAVEDCCLLCRSLVPTWSGPVNTQSDRNSRQWA